LSTPKSGVRIYKGRYRSHVDPKIARFCCYYESSHPLQQAWRKRNNTIGSKQRRPTLVVRCASSVEDTACGERGGGQKRERKCCILPCFCTPCTASGRRTKRWGEMMEGGSLARLSHRRDAAPPPQEVDGKSHRLNAKSFAMSCSGSTGFRSSALAGIPSQIVMIALHLA
jgi:hypothetical protein